MLKERYRTREMKESDGKKERFVEEGNEKEMLGKKYV